MVKTLIKIRESSNINEVIRTNLKPFYFFHEEILHTQKKAQNANKRLLLRYFYASKKYKKQTSDFHS